MAVMPYTKQPYNPKPVINRRIMRRILLILLIVGCQKPNTDYQFWHAMGGPLGDAVSYIVSKTKLKEVNLGSYNTLSQRLISFAISKRLPLISQTFPSWAVEFYKKGLVIPIDSVLPDSVINKIHPKLLEEVKYKGVLISIPFNKSVPVIFYNANLMDSLGLKVPKTWDELREVCINAKRKGIWGFAFSIDPWIFYTIFKQKGGKDINFNSPEGLEALNYLRNLVLVDSCAYLGSGYSHQDDFASQKVLMIWATSVSYAFMKPKVKFKMGVVPIPVDKYDSVVISGTNLTIFKGHRQDEYREVVNFVSLFLTDSIQMFWSSRTGYSPITKINLAPKELIPVFKQIERATYEPKMEIWMRGRRYFATEVMEPVLKGILSPEEALKGYEKILKTLE